MRKPPFRSKPALAERGAQVNPIVSTSKRQCDDCVSASLAPRPFFSNSPLHDENFDVTGVKKAIPAALEIYRLLGASDRLQVRYPNVGHAFPAEVREEAYRFIDKALDHTPGRVRGE